MSTSGKTENEKSKLEIDSKNIIGGHKKVEENATLEMAFKKKIKENSELTHKYNELVDKYNLLIDEKSLQSAFTQGVFDINPFKRDDTSYRGFNICVYLKEGKNSQQVNEALNSLIEMIGFDSFIDSEIKGSWFKRLTTISKEQITEDKVISEIQKVKKHIDNITVNKSQADIDNKLAGAVADLLKATEGEESLFLFGSFVVVRKFGNSGKLQNVIKTLSTEEQLIIASDQTILQNPDNFFELLNDKMSKFYEERKQVESIADKDTLTG